MNEEVQQPSNGNGNGSANGGDANALSATRGKYLQSEAELRALDTGVLLDRLQFMRQAGITFNGLRDTYALFGYDRVITAKQYRDTYHRGGIAKRIVEAYPKATWRGGVEVFEDEDPDKVTPFEQACKDLDTKVHIWQRFQQADILAGLSTYSVLLIGAPGILETPLPKGKPGQLLYVQPFSGGGGPGPNQQTSGDSNYVDTSIFEFETNAQNERFGLPRSYQLRRTDFTSPQLQVPVHWSRIIHVAEGTLDNDVYGIPTLENVWNLLSDLEKVTGGGSEAFWLRANAGMQVDVDKDMALPPDPAELAKLREDVEAYKHNITRILRTRGVNINQLGSDVANFALPADAIMKQIAGSKGIPMRILTGSEMGQLASGQDADNWDTQVQDRRTSYAGPSIARRFFDRLIEYGYLPEPKQYEVGWPTKEDMTAGEKATFAVSLAQVNSTQGSIVFTDEEIRDMSFTLKPLSPADKQKAADEQGKLAAAKNPIPPAVGPDGKPLKPGDKPAPGEKKAGPQAVPRAAEEQGEYDVQGEYDELLEVLQDAITENNLEVVDRILGLQHSWTPDFEVLGDLPGHAFHGNQYGQPLAADHPDHESAKGLAERLKEGEHIQSSTLNQYKSKDTNHRAFKATIEHHLKARGLSLTPRQGTTLVRTSRGGASIGAAKGYTVKAVDFEVLGDVPGHEFHGNQYTSATLVESHDGPHGKVEVHLFKSGSGREGYHVVKDGQWQWSHSRSNAGLSSARAAAKELANTGTMRRT